MRLLELRLPVWNFVLQRTLKFPSFPEVQQSVTGHLFLRFFEKKGGCSLIIIVNPPFPLESLMLRHIFLVGAEKKNVAQHQACEGLVSSSEDRCTDLDGKDNHTTCMIPFIPFQHNCNNAPMSMPCYTYIIPFL